MFNVKPKVIPVVTGAKWKHLTIRQYLSNTVGKHKIMELLKTAKLGTAHIMRKVLKYEYRTCIFGNNITHTTHYNHRVTATLHTTEVWFVSGT
jgi:hypothetical protein